MSRRFHEPGLYAGLLGMACVLSVSCSAVPEQAAEDVSFTAGGADQAGGRSSTAGGPFTSGGMSAAGSAVQLTGGAGIGGAAGARADGGSGGAGGAASVNHCKRGIGMAGASLTNPQIVPGVAWWYNWALSRQAVAPGLEFVPMVWGSNALKDAGAKLPSDARFLLGFNEPNFFAQSNLSAAAAAQLWPELEAVAKAKGLELVSPAVNYCGDDMSKTGPCHDTNPVSYLTDFFAACGNCRVDYVAVHWYNCSAAELQFYLGQFRRFNRPIWLTEFACAYGGDASVAGQEAYMRAVVPLLEADSHVYRYSWFSGTDELPTSRLLEASGELTALGKVYASLPHGAGCKN